MMPGILANANVAIKEAVGLGSAGNRRPLQCFTFINITSQDIVEFCWVRLPM